MTNILRHGRATTAEIRIEADGNGAALEISNDGPFPAVPAALVTGVQPIQSSFAPARLAAFAARDPS